jgi:hypothetical protein
MLPTRVFDVARMALIVSFSNGAVANLPNAAENEKHYLGRGRCGTNRPWLKVCLNSW